MSSDIHFFVNRLHPISVVRSSVEPYVRWPKVPWTIPLSAHLLVYNIVHAWNSCYRATNRKHQIYREGWKFAKLFFLYICFWSFWGVLIVYCVIAEVLEISDFLNKSLYYFLCAHIAHRKHWYSHKKKYHTSSKDKILLAKILKNVHSTEHIGAVTD